MEEDERKQKPQRALSSSTSDTQPLVFEAGQNGTPFFIATNPAPSPVIEPSQRNSEAQQRPETHVVAVVSPSFGTSLLNGKARSLFSDDNKRSDSSASDALYTIGRY